MMMLKSVLFCLATGAEPLAAAQLRGSRRELANPLDPFNLLKPLAETIKKASEAGAKALQEIAPKVQEAAARADVQGATNELLNNAPNAAEETVKGLVEGHLLGSLGNIACNGMGLVAASQGVQNDKPLGHLLHTGCDLAMGGVRTALGMATGIHDPMPTPPQYPAYGPGYGQGPAYGPGYGQGPAYGPGYGQGPAYGQGVDANQLPAYGQGVDANQLPAYGPGVDANQPPAYGQGVDANQPPAYGPGVDANQLPAYGPGVDANQPPAYGPGVDANQPPAYGPGVDANQPPAYEPGMGANQPPAYAPGMGANQPPAYAPGMGANQPPAYGQQEVPPQYLQNLSNGANPAPLDSLPQPSYGADLAGDANAQFQGPTPDFTPEQLQYLAQFQGSNSAYAPA